MPILNTFQLFHGFLLAWKTNSGTMPQEIQAQKNTWLTYGIHCSRMLRWYQVLVAFKSNEDGYLINIRAICFQCQGLTRTVWSKARRIHPHTASKRFPCVTIAYIKEMCFACGQGRVASSGLWNSLKFGEELGEKVPFGEGKELISHYWAIFFWGTDLSSLEISCDAGKPPGPIWRWQP